MLQRSLAILKSRVRTRRDVAILVQKVRKLYARGGLRLVKDRSLLYLRQFARNDYSEWIRRYDTLTNDDRATMRARAESFSHKPVISVVMSTYNSRPELVSRGHQVGAQASLYPLGIMHRRRRVYDQNRPANFATLREDGPAHQGDVPQRKWSYVCGLQQRVGIGDRHVDRVSRSRRSAERACFVPCGRCDQQAT